MIHIVYFASLRDQLQRSQDQLPFSANLTPELVWQALHHSPLPCDMLMAINHSYAQPNSPLHAGDELAFFPPVTGG